MMQLLRSGVARGTIWNSTAYIIGQALRFATSVLTTRFLAPELFGLMLIVNTIRSGAELLSDIGIAQSLIQSRDAEEPEFFNTAWTLQVIRGAILFFLCLILAIPVSSAYDQPVLAPVIALSGLTFAIGGFNSVAPHLLKRRMSFSQLTIYEIAAATGFSIFQVGIAYLYPTIWALVVGLLFGSMLTLIGSFLLLRDVKHRLTLSKTRVSEIVQFGKWIAVASAVYYATTSFDRIYLAGELPLQVLGVYAIARTIADIIATLFGRLSSSVVFPYVASQAAAGRELLRAKIGRVRGYCLALIAVAIGSIAGIVDLLVGVLFDGRYAQAKWMSMLLVAGVWFSILSALSEALLLGLGKSAYGVASNGAKLLWLVLGLPVGVGLYGTVGAVIVVAIADLFRYIPVCVGQVREGTSFLAQELAMTCLLLCTFGLIFLLRSSLGIPLPM
jgi:O-antigen/teichoic acid export membrane protein